MATAVVQRQSRLVARPVPARTRRPRAPRLRLTLLARRLVALMVTLVIVSMAVWTATALRSEASGDAGTVAATVVVGAGETVWDIANAYLPAGQSAHGYVARVLRYNDIDAAAVAPGTVLQLPRS